MSSQSSNVVIPSLCRGYILSSKIVSYSPRDIILYALSVGLSNSNALDELDLKFTYEFSPEFSVLPSFPVVLTSFDDMFEGLNNCSGIPNFNPMMLLHGEQKIVFCQSTNTTTTNRSATTTTTIDEEERREGRTGGDVSVHFPVESKVSVVSRIIDVVDKIKGALVIIETEGRQQQEDNGEQIIAGEGGDEKNNLMFKIYISLFIRGIGGFSNDKKNELIVEDIFDRNVEKPKRKPDVIVDRSTFPSQALLYRLNGITTTITPTITITTITTTTPTITTITTATPTTTTTNAQPIALRHFIIISKQASKQFVVFGILLILLLSCLLFIAILIVLFFCLFFGRPKNMFTRCLFFCRQVTKIRCMPILLWQHLGASISRSYTGSARMA
eukprot:GHVS01069083.1.p1 GENE.GHVS01069083.1~~GHVS01069083.1.p1  ORF type:complete len:386 (-),score=78.42 GHVS01069083.1:323-1480(-)